MSPLPYLLLVALVTMFIYDYVPNKALLAAAYIIAFAAIAAYWLLRGSGGSGFKRSSFLRLAPAPLLDFAGKKYCAIALSIATPSDPPSSRLENEINYERLCKFNDTIASLGIPVAYIVYCGGKKPSLLQLAREQCAQSIVVTWASGENGSALYELCEAHTKQLEGICGVIFPNAQLSRLDRAATSLLLSSPIAFALDQMQPVPAPFPTHPAAAPPPATMASPSITLPVPEPEMLGGDGPFLGWAFSSGKRIGPLSFSLNDIQRHIALFGTTGSGKSTTAISLAFRLSSAGISVLVLDWHGEHSRRTAEAGGKVFSPGAAEGGLTVNPLLCTGGRDLGFQGELITAIFTQVFQFTAPQSYKFRATLKACDRSRLNPTLSELIKELGLLPIRSSWDHETRMALMRRLKAFTEGACGLATNGDDSVFRDELFKGMVCIDLSSLKDVNSRSSFAHMLLKILYDRAAGRSMTHLEHVTFIDEAQNVIPPRRPEQPRSIGERILAELRKYGEGVVVIPQIPASISFEGLKNSAIRIIHSIRSGEDLKIIEDATSMTPRQTLVLPALAIGEAVVNLPYRSSNIFVRVVPDPLVVPETATEVVLRSCRPSQASLSS